MKKLVFLAALLCAGCDLFGIHGSGREGDTITYLIESDEVITENMPAVSYWAAEGQYAHATPTEYPWETTIPYFEGVKLLTALSMERGTTLSILHNGEVIATTSADHVLEENAVRHLGVIAGAEWYDVETRFEGSGVTFSTNYITLDGMSDFDTSNEHWKGGLLNKSRQNPGTQLEFAKVGDGEGIFSIRVVRPFEVNLATFAGRSSTSVATNLGAK